jgi:hypothetical protein
VERKLKRNDNCGAGIRKNLHALSSPAGDPGYPGGARWGTQGGTGGGRVGVGLGWGGGGERGRLGRGRDWGRQFSPERSFARTQVFLLEGTQPAMCQQSPVTQQPSSRPTSAPASPHPARTPKTGQDHPARTPKSHSHIFNYSENAYYRSDG